MTSKSRLNPNKGSRQALKQLEDKGILSRQKVGLRHIIKADSTVHFVGHDIGFEWHNREIPNFYPGVERSHDVVLYNNQRAELTTTLGRPEWEGHLLDVATHFPANLLATQLMNAARAANGHLSSDTRIAYGDAVLVTDNRMHWILRSNQNQTSIEDVEMFNDTLSTPRHLLKQYGHAQIFFYTEPSQTDIVAIKLRWF
jgi:hypothetical protein